MRGTVCVSACTYGSVGALGGQPPRATLPSLVAMELFALSAVAFAYWAGSGGNEEFKLGTIAFGAAGAGTGVIVSRRPVLGMLVGAGIAMLAYGFIAPAFQAAR